jgi:uncharacterized protein
MIPVIMVFAKAPVPGKVKTRLQPVLTPEESAELHHSFVADVLEWLAGFSRVADVELHVDGITDAWRDYPYRRVLQRDGDLGFRMLSAAEHAIEEGRKQVLIVGSDSPNLPPRYLLDLLQSEAEVALGPCEDGGYYAIKMRQVHPKMFEGVSWGTDQALAQTRAACERCGFQVELGREWFDVDSPADLVKLVTHPTPPRTTEWLRRRGLLAGEREYGDQ